MANCNHGVSGAVAAVFLAILTIVVFWVLQDYGPESAIRRFHEGVAKGDSFEVQQVLVEPVNDPVAMALEFKVNQLARANADYRIVRMDRSPDRVAAEVQYVLPDRTSIGAVWTVVKRERTWRVLAEETWQPYGLYPSGNR